MWIHSTKVETERMSILFGIQAMRGGGDRFCSAWHDSLAGGRPESLKAGVGISHSPTLSNTATAPGSSPGVKGQPRRLVDALTAFNKRSTKSESEPYHSR